MFEDQVTPNLASGQKYISQNHVFSNISIVLFSSKNSTFEVLQRDTEKIHIYLSIDH